MYNICIYLHIYEDISPHKNKIFELGIYIGNPIFLEAYRSHFGKELFIYCTVVSKMTVGLDSKANSRAEPYCTLILSRNRLGMYMYIMYKDGGIRVLELQEAIATVVLSGSTHSADHAICMWIWALELHRLHDGIRN